MSNAARKDRKRKNEKFEKAAKIPTYPVGLPRPKHSATPYQFAKAIDRALIAAAKPSKADPELIAEGNRVHAEAARKVMAKVEETYESGEVEPVKAPGVGVVTGERFDNAACPTCHAAPDEPCMTRAGKVASKPHAGR